MKTLQLVVFNIDDDSYGLNLMNVKSILPYKESTRIPATPEYIEGFISLRGDIIVLINLQKNMV